MIFIVADIPPADYRITCEHRLATADLYGDQPLGFIFVRDDRRYRSVTSNTPSRSVSNKDRIGSPWRVQTSATAVDQTLEVEADAVDADAVDAALDVPGQLAGIRRMTGYGWEKVAGLVGNSRQAAHRWMSGEAITDGNRERVARLHAAISYFDRGNSDDNRDVLDKAVDGTTVAMLLQDQRFEEAMASAGRGPGRQDARWGKVIRQSPDPEDHWLARLAAVDDAVETEPVRAKPQTFKRLTLKKG